MAGDWIKWIKGLTRKPEVLAISEALSMDRRAVASRCMEVWEWWDENSPYGSARGVTLAFLDELVGAPGFASAMADEHWLVESRDGMMLPNFDRHNGEPAKTRALGQKRAKTHRDGKSVTKPSPEKRRGDKSKSKRKTPPPPRGAQTDKLEAFMAALPQTHHGSPMRAALAEWVTYRAQLRKALTPLTITRQAKKLGEVFPHEAVEALERSIENGWTKIVFTESGPPGTSARPQGSSHRQTRSAREFPESRDLPTSGTRSGTAR